MVNGDIRESLMSNEEICASVSFRRIVTYLGSSVILDSIVRKRVGLSVSWFFYRMISRDSRRYFHTRTAVMQLHIKRPRKPLPENE